MNTEFWRGKDVLITGHTGFKGGWTSLLLSNLGANVHGIALPPYDDISLYNVANVKEVMGQEFLIDIRDAEALHQAVSKIQPDVILHMAAQSLVRESYADPVSTFATNMIGTINLFEAARKLEKQCVIVNVTSDKCYENQEWHWPYRENEPMGGHDPYSCSKGCSELITASYRNSFFKGSNIQLSSGRAGNVIGGGDWSENRLVPDIFRAHSANLPMTIRAPDAIRPWQFVLEPISGYCTLAEHLFDKGSAFAEGWNFGPDEEASQTVQWITERFLGHLKSSSTINIENAEQHEAGLLKLDSSKAKAHLGWHPKLDIQTCLKWTADWYLAYGNSENMRDVSMAQIAQFLSLSKTGV